MISVADRLVSLLREAGINRVFGLPGGGNIHFLDALRRQDVQFVLVHHESSAVYMASATARLTRKPSVCVTTLGPGATNAVSGVAHAFLDRSPVLVLTAQIPKEARSRQSHQSIDLEALFAPITKSSMVVHDGNVDAVVSAALQIAAEGRQGPVHLQLSSVDAARAVSSRISRALSDTGPELTNLEIDLAHKILAAAQRPIIVVGLGLEPEGPYDNLRRLAEELDAPVITTPKAKGALPDSHELAAGTLGLTHDDPAYRLLDESDCVVAIGFDVVELVKPWEQNAPLIWIASWPNRNPRIAAEVELVGLIIPILKQLLDRPLASTHWGARRMKAHRKELAGRPAPTPARGLMLPQHVLQVARESIPENAIVATDVGSHKILAALDWPAYRSNSYLVSNGLSAMGFGLPAAIAASLCHPNRVVLCLVGDAGLAMSMGELGVLSRLRAPVLLIVFNDGALDLIRSRQLDAGKPVFGTVLSNPDYSAIAGGFGIGYERVDSYENCVVAIRTAIERRRPTLIDARIDPEGYPTTPSMQNQ